MSNGGLAKICVICGEDCSGKPRTKDPKGRYYCQACYAAALEKEKYGAALVDDDGGYGVMGSLLDDVGETGRACAQCGALLAPDAVLCVACGYNTSTGDLMPTYAAAPPRMGGARSSGGSAWPIVVGVISIVLAAAGIMVYGFNALGGVLASNDSAGSAAPALGSVLWIALSAWLLVSGIGVTMRRPGAVRSLKAWAITKVVLVVTCFSCLGGLIGFMSSQITDEQSRMFEAELGFDPSAAIGLFVLVLLIGAVIQLAWPVFVLIWLGRNSVQEDIARW